MTSTAVTRNPRRARRVWGLRNMLLMLTLAVLCIVGYFVLSTPDADDGTKLPPNWPKFDRSEVTAITVKGQGSKVELRKREGSKDRWDVVEGTETLRADANKVDDLLTQLSRQTVRDRIRFADLEKGDIEGYQLHEPSIEVLLTGTGSPVEVRYGKTSQEGTKIYMDTGVGTDVWIVPRDAFEHALATIAVGVKDTRVFDSTLYDVQKLEIIEGGVTRVLVSKDLNQVWHIDQPFRGYANPTKFEAHVLNPIVNAQIEKWAEIGAPDLTKYGLDKPKYEVRIVPKSEGRSPESLLVGNASPEGSVFVMEPGTRVVGVLPKSFLDAVSTQTNYFRDLSFTRLGHGGVAVDVKLGKVMYRLESVGPSMWDVVMGTERRPADGEKVRQLLDQIREWQSVEFLDTQKPEDLGIDGKDFVVIEREPVGKEPGQKIILFISAGQRPDGKTVYAQRKDDGGPEKVDAAVIDRLLLGPVQFFRTSVKEIALDTVAGFSREAGFGDEGARLQTMKVRRELDAKDKSWSKDGPGLVGDLDWPALNGMLDAVRSIRAVQWLTYAPEKDNERFEFRPPRASTMTFTIHLNSMGSEHDPVLYIGKRRPEGGYFARMNDTGDWAFVLDDAVVEALKKPIAKD